MATEDKFSLGYLSEITARMEQTFQDLKGGRTPEVLTPPLTPTLN